MFGEPKRLANLAKHGMDFADVDEAFFENAVVIPAKDGRFIAVGHHLHGAVVVVFAPLGREAISVVSMRPASRRERAVLR